MTFWTYYVIDSKKISLKRGRLHQEVWTLKQLLLIPTRYFLLSRRFIFKTPYLTVFPLGVFGGVVSEFRPSNFLLSVSKNRAALESNFFFFFPLFQEMASLFLPSKLNYSSSSSLFPEYNQSSLFIFKRPRKLKKTHSPVARLFGPSIFESSKLKVLFLGVDEKKHPGNLPRTYTLTHSDITSKLTLAISQTINNSQLQGWTNKIYRDEVVAEWRKVKESMSLHVHCHISGGHFFLDLVARLRVFIFTKELPLVLTAFAHGDGNLLNNYPDLQDALVWVYFHSNIPEFNRVECWGPLKEAGGSSSTRGPTMPLDEIPNPCQEDCSCCFPPMTSIRWSKDPDNVDNAGTHQGLNQQI